MVGTVSLDSRVRTEEQHLDFTALIQFIALELVLNLLIPGLPLLLLGAHTATHYAVVWMALLRHDGTRGICVRE